MKLVCFLVIFCCSSQLVPGQDTSVIEEPKPFILGRVIELQSTVLSEKRTLNIYVPAGYDEQDSIKYPVIYLLDGSADEDFIHITGLVHFLNFPWVDLLPKSIVVGIANVDRRRDLTYPTKIKKDKIEFPSSGKSENFMTFIESEVQPYVNRNYKTNTSRTIIGQSLGGLFATEILFKKPYLFDKYVIVSPSLWWDNESLLKLSPHLINTTLKNDISIYIATGNEGKMMDAGIKKLVNILSTDKNKKVSFEKFSKESHASILHHAAYNAFVALNKKAEDKR